MTYIITEVKEFDHKRNKVTLDYGEVTFLLYKGECRQLKIGVTKSDSDDKTLSKYNGVGHIKELSEAAYQKIMDEILLPRAKKKMMYYLKNGDKSRSQIRQKLKEGYYPEEIIKKTFEFLDKYHFADDNRYAENFIEEFKKTKSRREIEMKLAQKGVRGSMVKELLSEVSQEDEYLTCEKTLKKKYPNGITKEERQKAFAYLARRGFSYDAIEHAMAELKADIAEEYTY